jgi:hypothetical protein
MNKTDIRRIIKEEISKVLKENEETTTVQIGRAKVTIKTGTEITPEMEQLIGRYDRNYRYIDDYTQMKDAEGKNNEIMKQLQPLGITRIM